ncbi:thiol-specific monooxygenase [Immersiella caudata]|uniref:Thiol-specific monooxygenase n=1 Tax=Immersiella caudata TaxID=314043 RepID=A0AA39XC74_9PEZI|nr:thiol-specific monooxygenase [Immersiella caudata]
MSPKAQRVAVIGAGPAGAITTDALFKEQVFSTIRVFDRRPIIGGTWVHTPHLPPGIPSLPALLSNQADLPIPIPTSFPIETPKSDTINSHQLRFSDSAQHEHLHSNITPEIMSYTQEPFPTTLSERVLKKYGPGAQFRHREVIREWVEGIFLRGGYDKFLSLSTTVERAEKVNGEWVLTLRKEGAGRDYWWQEKFDALVVASGHYNVPWLPELEGLLEFDRRWKGRVVHSKHFRKGEEYKGKKVIVVGGSVSAHEIVHEILPFAKHPVIASLRGDPIPSFGWAPFRHPHIEVKKQISKLDAETGDIHFVDGSVVKGADHIIFATGYTFSLPFLPQVQGRILKAYRRLPGVYQHTFDTLDQTLTYVGMLGGGFTFRVYEWQAVAVARHLAGRARALPSISEQQAWEARRVSLKGGGKNYYSIAPDYQEFFDFLREIAGDPAEGTTGRVLPKFDPAWLKIWVGMTGPKIRGFEESRRLAEEDIEAAKESIKAKL